MQFSKINQIPDTGGSSPGCYDNYTFDNDADIFQNYSLLVCVLCRLKYKQRCFIVLPSLDDIVCRLPHKTKHFRTCPLLMIAIRPHSFLNITLRERIRFADTIYTMLLLTGNCWDDAHVKNFGSLVSKCHYLIVGVKIQLCYVLQDRECYSYVLHCGLYVLVSSLYNIYAEQVKLCCSVKTLKIFKLKFFLYVHNYYIFRLLSSSILTASFLLLTIRLLLSTRTKTCHYLALHLGYVVMKFFISLPFWGK